MTTDLNLFYSLGDPGLEGSDVAILVKPCEPTSRGDHLGGNLSRAHVRVFRFLSRSGLLGNRPDLDRQGIVTRHPRAMLS